MFAPITALTQAYHSDPVHYFHALKSLSDFVWLDSGRPESSQGRYDIFCALATSKFIIDRDGKHWLYKHGQRQASSPSLLEQWVSEHTTLEGMHQQLPDSNLQGLPFVGGVIGCMGYSWQNPQFQLPLNAPYSGNLAEFYAFNWALLIDHETKTATLVGDEQAITAIAKLLAAPSHTEKPFFQCSAFKADISRSQYLNAIAAIHEYILAGDCYQVNYAQRFSASYQGDLDLAYLKLRNATPSPFSAYFKCAQNPVLSLSPERFLAFDGAQVLTQPIKGSSPRGQDPNEDAALAEALLNSEKNRAENVMIVDLLRNDLSQCCKPFSVKVPKLFELQSFANVHHLVSTVVGELEQDCQAFTLFKRSFPGGSITGAPKKRAMEIIAELEPHNRGTYCGSIAYFSRNGKADSSITIRTLQADGEQLYCWGGGGIVLDSVADKEYEESLFKVDKLMRALSTEP